MTSVDTIKFHAGKIDYDSETKNCISLPHKGSIIISNSIEDPNFLQFSWTPKLNFTIINKLKKDNFLLIPGDVLFTHVKSCKTGRVFCLTFLSSGSKHFYWLQDIGDSDDPSKLTENDLKILNKIQNLLSVKSSDQEQMNIDSKTDEFIDDSKINN